MPRLNKQIADAVFFLYGINPKPNAANGFEGPLGSGVLIGIKASGMGTAQHVYAVTAAHVVAAGGSAIQINTRQNASRIIDLDVSDWIYDLNVEDIAIADVTDLIDIEKDKIRYIHLEMFATVRRIDTLQIGIGEDGFMLGYFSGKTNLLKNEIAARFGNVSLLADPATPITRGVEGQKIQICTPCHVFDMHSRPGFSGSPVFIYRTPESDLTAFDRRTTNRRVLMPGSNSERIHERPHGQEVTLVELEARESRFLLLLGIHVSQFYEKVRIRKLPGATYEAEVIMVTENEDDVVRNNDSVRLPGSMTIVVPADRILQLLDHTTLEKDRRARNDRHMNGGGSASQ